MTTTRDDYLLVTPEGEYIVISEHQTMVGTRYEYSTTKDIDKASTLWGRLLNMRDISAKYPGWHRIPCKITRRVELVTEELNFNLTTKE